MGTSKSLTKKCLCENMRNILEQGNVQQLRIRLGNRQLQVNDQSQFPRQVESDLESKFELIQKLNYDLHNIKILREQMVIFKGKLISWC